ncbi:unnamed protein product [Schistosoma turkestanicum]|nr:unnamed protein product [Schistosoma turkestanicum]
MSNQALTCSGVSFTNAAQDDPLVYEINHSKEIIPCISQLYRNEAFSDVTLVVQNTHFPAHRAILAARSEYFRALFYGGLAESSSSIVHLNDINVTAFKSILHYIYTGQMKLKKPKLTLSILCLAHQYNFRSLENVISTYLTHSLSVKNVWCIYDLAVMYNLDGLITACLRFLDCLAPATLHNPRFLRLSQSSVERLLSRDSFCASEIEIFRAICAWLRNSKELNCQRTLPTSHSPNIPESNDDNNNHHHHHSVTEQTRLSIENVESAKESSSKDNVSTTTTTATTTTTTDTTNISTDSRCTQLMRQCVRFELMSLTELLTEVRSSKLVSSEELLDAINRQTNCPDKMLHRGFLLPGVNLASPRFGCTLIAGEKGTYPHFFVDTDELNTTTNTTTTNKLNIESLNINDEPDYSNVDYYSVKNLIATTVAAVTDDDSDSIDDVDDDEEEEDIDEELDEIHRRSQQQQQQPQQNTTDQQIQAPSTMEMMFDNSGQLFSQRENPVQLPRSSLSEGVAWSLEHTLNINNNNNNDNNNNNNINNNSWSSLHNPTTSNQSWSSNAQNRIQPNHHHHVSISSVDATNMLNTTANDQHKPARWIQPSSTRQHGGSTSSSQHRSTLPPAPPHSEYDVVRHSLTEPNANIIIRLGKPSIVNTIRMQLWDQDLRSYSYFIDVSLDQSIWHRIVDYQNYMCRSWQTIYFPSRVIHYIRITGTKNTFNRTFHLITFRCFYSEKIFLQISGFMIPTYNVANVDHGATVLEGVSRNRNALIDGNIRMYDWNSGYTCHQLGNGAIVVQLAQPFLLRSMRFLLWDLDSRTYSYSVYVSNDRVDWKLIRDASMEPCRSWQIIRFPLQPVTFIRVVGSYNSANDVFHLVHLECPYPLAQTEEDINESNFVNISNSPINTTGHTTSTSTTTTNNNNNNSNDNQEIEIFLPVTPVIVTSHNHIHINDAHLTNTSHDDSSSMINTIGTSSHLLANSSDTTHNQLSSEMISNNNNINPSHSTNMTTIGQTNSL